MMGWRYKIAMLCFFILFFCVSVEAVRALSLKELYIKAKKTTVYITYEAVDSQTGAVNKYNGSGFIVSGSGYILTAYHVIKPWLMQNHAEQNNRQIFVQIGSLYEPSLAVQVSSFETDDPYGSGPDVALLKIRRNGEYSASTICFDPGIGPGQKLAAFGFPSGTELNHSLGELSGFDGPGDRWVANINVDYGMSGGPVYDMDSGSVVGIVKGGLSNVGPVRYVTQLAKAWSKLGPINTVKNCSTSVARAISPASGRADGASPKPSCRDVTFTDFSRLPPTYTIQNVCE